MRQPYASPAGLVLALLFTMGCVLPQALAGPPTASSTGTAAGQLPVDKNQPEIAGQDAPILFKSRVNLVMVPVVVRDGKGRAVGSLTQDQFHLFDKGKTPRDYQLHGREAPGCHRSPQRARDYFRRRD